MDFQEIHEELVPSSQSRWGWERSVEGACVQTFTYGLEVEMPDGRRYYHGSVWDKSDVDTPAAYDAVFQEARRTALFALKRRVDGEAWIDTQALPQRVKHMLRRNKIYSSKQALRLKRAEWLGFHNVGLKTYQKILRPWLRAVAA